nr:gamma-1-syntrophin-like isoform X1 [Dermatophagoides farinae]
MFTFDDKMSKSELNETIVAAEKIQNNNGSSFRRFPFRSQSLRLNRKSKQQSNNKQQQQHSQSNSDRPQFIRQQTVNGSPSLSSSANSLTLSILLLKDRDLIISLPNGQNSSSTETNKQSTTPSFKLTRHQSIKSFQQNRSNSINLNNPSSNFLVGNLPPPNTNHSNFDENNTSELDDNNYEDEGVVTFEESEDEDFHPDDDVQPKSRIPGRYPRTVILNRDCYSRLGIKIVGGCDFGIPVIIIGLRPNSPAQISGEIFIGDQILSVNDVPINENNTHNDALRLLAECGTKVSLSLRHTKSVMNFGRKWKHQNFSTLDKMSTTNNEKNNDFITPKAINTTHRHMSLTLNPKDFNREKSISPDENADDESNCNRRINLFLAGISRFVSFSDIIRDAGFEIRTNNCDRSIVIECLSEDICLKWFTVIRNTIENLTNNFIRNFNKHFPKNEHFLYMGYVSERVLVESPLVSSMQTSLFSSKSLLFSHLLSPLKSSLHHHHHHRWLSRFLIVKGGKIYLFKVAPTETLLNYKRKMENILFQRKHRANSNGSSLGSVGSGSTSTSDTSNFSNANSTNHLNGLYVTNNGCTDNNSTLSTSPCISKAISSKPSRLNKFNKCIENELDLLSIEHWHCYQSDFRCLKSTEQTDNKHDCFQISNSQSEQKYFSIECNIELERLNDAWNMANYYSVLKNECKIYTVALEPGNIIGSFKIDWKSGFSFYDPKHNECVWSYRFYQLKHSSDDGKEILSLSFMLEPNRFITQHILRCSCLQSIIFSIHSFLRAKVFSLSL